MTAETSSFSSPISDSDSMHNLLKLYTSALKTFTTSPSTFQILHTLGSPITHFNSHSSSTGAPKTLYILDSSFNPPTLAHLRIATNALLHDNSHSTNTNSSSPKTSRRLLLLLAIQNADKPAKPASFEQRLVMMTIFAQDLLSSLSTTALSTKTTASKSQQLTYTSSEEIGIDIALTKHPYFHSKAEAITGSGIYSSPSQDKKLVEQVHLIGYDTLLRILSPKYYPPTHTLTPLHHFLAQHRLLVTYRAGDEWGSREEQDAYLAGVGAGELDGVEGKREWVKEGRIALVEGRKEGQTVVSSTKVRDAVKNANQETLKGLVTDGVAEWVLGEGLYLVD